MENKSLLQLLSFSLYVCVCVCVYTGVYMHIYVYTHSEVYIYKCIDTFIIIDNNKILMYIINIKIIILKQQY